eukprot:2832343-Pleurochrysis_carterae.AAC.1
MASLAWACEKRVKIAWQMASLAREGHTQMRKTSSLKTRGRWHHARAVEGDVERDVARFFLHDARHLRTQTRTREHACMTELASRNDETRARD